MVIFFDGRPIEREDVPALVLRLREAAAVAEKEHEAAASAYGRGEDSTAFQRMTEAAEELYFAHQRLADAMATEKRLLQSEQRGRISAAAERANGPLREEEDTNMKVGEASSGRRTLAGVLGEYDEPSLESEPARREALPEVIPDTRGDEALPEVIPDTRVAPTRRREEETEMDQAQKALEEVKRQLAEARNLLMEEEQLSDADFIRLDKAEKEARGRYDAALARVRELRREEELRKQTEKEARSAAEPEKEGKEEDEPPKKTKKAKKLFWLGFFAGTLVGVLAMYLYVWFHYWLS
jgi:hypothetical protein